MAKEVWFWMQYVGELRDYGDGRYPYAYAPASDRNEEGGHDLWPAFSSAEEAMKYKDSRPPKALSLTMLEILDD